MESTPVPKGDGMSTFTFPGLWEGLMRHRRNDPAPSVRAAEAAYQFAGSQKEQMLACLKQFGRLSTHDLAEKTGLTIEQIGRRKKELERVGKVRVVSEDGRYSILEAV